MISKKTESKVQPLEVTFKDVFVCKKTSLRPYIEVFIHEPQNVSEENLGTIAGILEVNDRSEESSYVVNYLISVIKKEFFSRVKRGSVESFEAALHKANLALAKLAEHESIGWIGKINAALVAIEKNNIHFSQTGDAKALLLRGSQLTDLGDGSENGVPNPLKTFVDVVSGRLEKGDKLVLTSRHMFEIFSVDEIKRSALKFSSPEFLQFLKTALGNELDCAAVLYLETYEKKIIEAQPQPVSKYEKFNAFSQSAFAKKNSSSAKKTATFKEEDRLDLMTELKSDVEKLNGNFVDKKTGHIYIKEDTYLKEDGPSFQKLRDTTSEVSLLFSAWFSKAKILIKSVFVRSSNRLSSLKRQIRESYPVNQEGLNDDLSQESLENNEVSYRKKLPVIWKKLSKYFLNIKPAFSKMWAFLSSVLKHGVNFFKKFQTGPERQGEKITVQDDNILAGENFLPKFNRLKNLFFSLSHKQKIIAVSAVLALFIVPYIFIKIQIKEEEKEFVEPAVTVETPPLPLSQEQNLVRLDNLNSQGLPNEAMQLVNLKGKIFVLTSQEIFDIENQAGFALPETLRPVRNAAGMNDLNLIFILGENGKLFSFSPVNRQFQENNISIPDGSDISLAGAYMTYIYLIDKKSNQIYRYPRASNGFGEKKNWLNDDLDVSKVKGSALSDNVYVALGDSVVKLFMGKKEAFNLASTATPVNPHKIYTQPDMEHIYVLDKVNARLLKTDVNGNVLSQYHHQQISQATDFTYNSQNNMLYFSSAKNIFYFPAT